MLNVQCSMNFCSLVGQQKFPNWGVSFSWLSSKNNLSSHLEICKDNSFLSTFAKKLLREKT